MIVFDLHCDQGHRFEGWFGSSNDFDNQMERGLIDCPECGSKSIGKAPMAPSVGTKGNKRESRHPAKEAQLSNAPMPPEVEKAIRQLANAQAKALESSKWVGDKFAEEARSQHYGEKDETPIHGKATRKEAEELAAEGISVAPILFPIAEPDQLN
ncbi:DUF1178 family protein [Qipengyuania huizhouensis]|uniref:DUF1178 family protein n=1 Tax=Qipengyuania huizhouensis TaxID=2867245 RepID=UPI0018155851|nr:DUF1178 family protein [Qipengyuania huizhouensis]MBA4765313.1 DUF1178 family protein [Erythrobacter sp.]MBX7461072.1 DUF1178 family protein [Qipengyuania huizhouensis]